MNLKGISTTIMAVIGVASCGIGAAYAYGRKKFKEGKRAFAEEVGLNYEKYEKKFKFGKFFRNDEEKS